MNDKISNRLLEHLASFSVFVISMVAYWATVDKSASFWDCPEYITCASLLEIGHPPGNPVWMLAMRAATIPFPPQYHALVISLWSGLFMALAAFFLSKVTFSIILYVATKYSQIRRLSNPIAPVAAACGGAIAAGMSFALCDSAWFSATEAEVYAMSSFMTALSLWLMILWAKSYSRQRRGRIIILIAYLMGLSLGVHQLNLLCIPALALIYVFRAHPYGKTAPRAWLALAVSLAIIALILIGVMGGTLAWMRSFELASVNNAGLPYFSGAGIYLILLSASAAAACVAIHKGGKGSMALCLTIFLWLSGIFVFKDNLWAGALLSAAAAAVATYGWNRQRARILTCVMSLVFILVGYSSFALIVIRGYAAPPMNEASPSDIFALSSYIARDQYGSVPLFYGATPYSRPLVEENFNEGDSQPDYSRFALKKGKARYAPMTGGARLSPRSRMLSHEDSASNSKIISSGKGYLLSDYAFSRVTAPELDMFLPRITGSSASDLESYESWTGMAKETMKKVAVSEAVDSSGNYVSRIGFSGEREQAYSYRPTYLQNLKFFLSYQVGYMYLRYLLWNYMGRQNDFPSTGEIDHGNFITGFQPIDRFMVGDTKLMPESASSDNPGHNTLYCIPFALGIAGIIFLFRSGSAGRRALAVTAALFFMTGIAIVIYLNQLPGEPRERDYSFLGSYMAFSIWVGAGTGAIGMWVCKTKLHNVAVGAIPATIGLALAIFLLHTNLDDHDRTGRSEPLDFASHLLLNETPSIIFSQGDNFTFPMWYAQEVMSVGRKHTVVDMSYLATPDYVVNLLKQGDRGLRLTAKPSDIAYGAYSYTRIAPDADTVPVSALDMLRNLYASREEPPVIHNRRVTLPGRFPGDTLTVDLRDFANGSSFLPFRKLMILDILATNAASKSPRQILFHSAMPTDLYKLIQPAARRLPFAISYNPGQADSTYFRTLAEAIVIPFQVIGSDSMPTIVADPLIAEQTRRQRGEITMAARIFMDYGYIVDSDYICKILEFAYPFSETSPGSFTVADTTFHEGIEFARLKMDLAERMRDKSNAIRAGSIVDDMLRESRQWRAYYASLPAWRRSTVSNSSRRLISVIPRLEAMKKESDSLISALPDESGISDGLLMRSSRDVMR